MSIRRSIRSRKTRKKLHAVFDLQLTSMLDILVIILVFLLKSLSTSLNAFSSTPGLELPVSASNDIPPDSLHLIITPEAMSFEDEAIVEFVKTLDSVGSTNGHYQMKTTDLDEGKKRILPLYQALIKAKGKAELLRAKSKARDETGQPLPFEGILAIQADKRTPYDIIRKVMYTAATAGFKVFRFLAVKKEG